MNPIILDNLSKMRNVFEQEGVVVAYVFGSQASASHATVLSDYDFAVLFSESFSLEERLKRRLNLAGKIAQTLQTNDIDVIDLEGADSLLRHQAIYQGMPLFVRDEKKRYFIESQALHEYEDFKPFRAVAQKALRDQIRAGTFGKPFISSYARYKQR